MKRTISTTYEPEEFKAIIEEVILTVIEGLDLSVPQTETQLITRQQTADLLGVSLPTLGQWAKRGIIPSYRIGNCVRYKREEVINSLKQVQSLKYKQDITKN